jgi:hypothetical protein
MDSCIFARGAVRDCLQVRMAPPSNDGICEEPRRDADRMARQDEPDVGGDRLSQSEKRRITVYMKVRKSEMQIWCCPRCVRSRVSEIALELSKSRHRRLRAQSECLESSVAT